jgi:hypothetical protein
MMENQKLTLQDYRNQIKLFKIKLALQVLQQNFSQLTLLDIAKVMMVDLKIISKLPGVNCDPLGYPNGLLKDDAKLVPWHTASRHEVSPLGHIASRRAERNRFDWYLVEACGTFENLSLTIACWQDLGVQKYLAISSQ